MRTFAILLLLMLSARHAAASDAAAWAALRADGHIALMRHADAPGVADPPGFRLDDCATQRNLSAKGRADAVAVGVRLKAQGARLGRIVSSPWCRCVDTAALMDIGRIEIEPTFSNAVVLSDRRAELAQGARDIMRAWKGPGALLAVTHGANIQALIGYNPGAGEIVVVTPQADGTLREIGRLPVPQR
ncbi:histidine phosphatase family protein [Vineibacter terrae]|uniref:Histidine phosphatase family protein n=1 Tax=Vineibacter terrae TaxID=2586908 RepID=A0A5C8PI94_9HYPH|nr:histidine phosphatase family protein [Vineibacter terrae]TXL73536.1 histidine phosphatase family protein [Vineibacter terrae]